MPAGQSSRARKHGVVAISTSAARSPGRDRASSSATMPPSDHPSTAAPLRHVRRDGTRQVTQRRCAFGPPAATVPRQVDEMQARPPRKFVDPRAPHAAVQGPAVQQHEVGTRAADFDVQGSVHAEAAGREHAARTQCLQCREQLLDLRRSVRGREREAQARRADGHGRRADRRHPETLFEQCVARRDGGRFSADQHRLDRRARRQRPQPQVRKPRTKSCGMLEHAAATPRFIAHHAQRFTCRGRHRRRQRRRVDVGARALQQALDQHRRARDERAERADCLAERAHQDRHVVDAESGFLDGACTRRAQHAEAVRIVDEQLRFCRRGRLRRSHAAAQCRRPC